MRAPFVRSLGSAYICPRCARTQRPKPTSRAAAAQAFSTSRILSNIPAKPPASGYARLTDRALVSVTGSDTTKFLHGLLTSSVPEQAPGGGFYSSFLTAQGRVLFDVFLYPTRPAASSSTGEEAGYLVEVDAQQRHVLLKHLKRHKLRSKVKLRALDEGELDVYAAWHEEQRWNAYSLGARGRDGLDDGTGTTSPGPELSLLDQRAPGMGQRLLLPRGSSSFTPSPALDGLEEASTDQYRIRRYLKGVPEGQAEMLREVSLPMGANLDLMGAIDFKKGCYVGQELTIRTHHTGVVRRRIVPVRLYDDDSGTSPADSSAQPEGEKEKEGLVGYDAGWTLGTPAPEAEVVVRGKRGKPAKWIAGVGNVGLAMARLEMMTDLPVTNEAGAAFDPADRFGVATSAGGEVGVVAVVPDWMRGKIRAPKVQKRVE